MVGFAKNETLLSFGSSKWRKGLLDTLWQWSRANKDDVNDGSNITMTKECFQITITNLAGNIQARK